VRTGRLPEERVHEAAGRIAELAAWTSPQPSRDREAGLEAARRAVRVDGDLALESEPLVVELWPEATIAAGPAEHGLGGILGARTFRLREGDPLPPLESDVVFVVRDAHRHPWQRELVPPGAIVVETGLPVWRPPEARAYLATHGAGRANLEAAAELLARR
jgi:beta-N-acetylhexosaminidase